MASDLLDDYIRNPTNAAAQKLSDHIVELSKEPDFCRLKPGLIYKVIEHCGITDQDKVAMIYKNITCYQKLSFREFYSHINKHHYEDSSLNHNDASHVGGEEMETRSVVDELKSRIHSLERKLINLENNFVLLEKGQEDFVSRMERNFKVAVSDLERMIKDLSDTVDKQQKQLGSLQDTVYRDSANKKDHTARIDELTENYSTLNLQVKEIRKILKLRTVSKDSPGILAKIGRYDEYEDNSNYSRGEIYGYAGPSSENHSAPSRSHSLGRKSISRERSPGNNSTNSRESKKSSRRNSPASYRVYTIFDCCENGDASNLKKLLQSKPHLVNETDEKNYGRTPLLCAVDRNHKELVEILLDYGADVNQQTEYGWTALHRAAYKNHVDMCKYLLKNGSHIDKKDTYGRSALFYGVFKGHKDVVEFLVNEGANTKLKDNNDENALYYANKSGRYDIASILKGKKH